MTDATSAPQAVTAGDIALLDHTLLFAHLQPAHKQQLFKALEERSYDSGASIVNEGDPGDGLYLVSRGEVSVFTRNEQLGVSLELATLKAGQVFGEMALLTQEKRSASVKAVGSASCYFLSSALFGQMVQKMPAVILGVAQTLARRLTSLNQQQGISFASLADQAFDPDVYALAPRPLLERHKIIPLALDGAVLSVAMVNPSNALALDDLRRIVSGVEIQPIAISEEDYTRFIAEKLAGASRAGATGVPTRGASPEMLRIEAAIDSDSKEPAPGPEVVQLLNIILAEGLERGCSDIHIDPDRHGVLVRFRIDGELIKREKLIPSSFTRPLLARIKVMSGMDPTDRKLPQDGRLSMQYRDHAYDARVATMPVRGGERVTLRVLDSSSALLDVNKLILSGKLATLVEQLVHRPQGIVLVTGPTGSGKTTTLYALLKSRVSAAKASNIVTAEDPIEYAVPGVVQTEISAATGLTFPRVLRGFLRQDPDVILIGETRDRETAEIAMQAAVTGHLVLSSMHTNSAVDSVVRLRDLGVPGYLIASALSGIVAQRLVRRNCPACVADRTISTPLFESLVSRGLAKAEQGPVMKAGQGCDACKGTGYKGRVGIYEVLPIAESTRALIGSDASIPDILAEAQRHGMVTLSQYGAFLLRGGITTADEVLSVLG